jgi:hypothetical protein
VRGIDDRHFRRHSGENTRRIVSQMCLRHRDRHRQREREKLKSKDETNENPIMEWREETLWVFVNKNTDLHKNNKQIRDTREIINFFKFLINLSEKFDMFDRESVAT